RLWPLPWARRRWASALAAGSVSCRRQRFFSEGAERRSARRKGAGCRVGGAEQAARRHRLVWLGSSRAACLPEPLSAFRLGAASARAPERGGQDEASPPAGAALRQGFPQPLERPAVL